MWYFSKQQRAQRKGTGITYTLGLCSSYFASTHDDIIGISVPCLSYCILCCPLKPMPVNGVGICKKTTFSFFQLLIEKLRVKEEHRFFLWDLRTVKIWQVIRENQYAFCSYWHGFNKPWDMVLEWRLSRGYEIFAGWKVSLFSWVRNRQLWWDFCLQPAMEPWFYEWISII